MPKTYTREEVVAIKEKAQSQVTAVREKLTAVKSELKETKDNAKALEKENTRLKKSQGSAAQASSATPGSLFSKSFR